MSRKRKIARGLNVGCGTNVIVADGWLNLDDSPTLLAARSPLRPLWPLLWPSLPKWPRAVVFCNATRLPFPNESVEVVHSSHFCEHLPVAGAIQYFREAHRVLVPWGIIRTVVPDLRTLAVDYVEGRNTADEFVERTHLVQPEGSGLYGLLRRMFRQGNYHHWMYDCESLSRRLAEAGFVSIRKTEYLESEIPEIGHLDVDSYRHESLYLEARKPG